MIDETFLFHQVDGPGTRERRRGPVIVKVADFRGESRENYEFVDPQLKAIRPRHGPQSGGTRIKILGTHMNAGSHIEAFVGKAPCRIVETRSDKAICITGASPTLTKEEVRMVFDRGTRVLHNKRYEYKEDPSIDYAHSGGATSGGSKVPKAIPSGGINVTVVGNSFSQIQVRRGVIRLLHFQIFTITVPALLIVRILKCTSTTTTNASLGRARL